MRFFKKLKLKAVALSLIVLTFVGAFTGIAISKVAKTNKTITVVIDAGHGGIDGGASGINTGARESDINLLIAKELEKLYVQSGFSVVMIRRTDEGLYGSTEQGFKLRDLKKRVEIINSSNADFLISIHLNVYSSPSRRGAQAFYKKGDKLSEKLAKQIQARINGLAIVPRLYNALWGDYYLLNESKIPSVIVECGFLSSPLDEGLLLTEEYRSKIADAIFGGSLNAFLNF